MKFSINLTVVRSGFRPFCASSTEVLYPAKKTRFGLARGGGGVRGPLNRVIPVFSRRSHAGAVVIMRHENKRDDIQVKIKIQKTVANVYEITIIS